MLVVAYRKRTISSLLLPLQLASIPTFYIDTDIYIYIYTHTRARAATSRDTQLSDIMYNTKSTVLYVHPGCAIVLLLRKLPQKD